MENIKFINNDEWSGCFVNNNHPPYKSNPLHQYTYTGSVEGNNIVFYQLYEHTFLYEEIMLYKILRWEPISVKRHCVSMLRNVIDGLNACTEFKN